MFMPRIQVLKSLLQHRADGGGDFRSASISRGVSASVIIINLAPFCLAILGIDAAGPTTNAAIADASFGRYAGVPKDKTLMRFCMDLFKLE